MASRKKKRKPKTSSGSKRPTTTTARRSDAADESRESASNATMRLAILVPLAIVIGVGLTFAIAQLLPVSDPEIDTPTTPPKPPVATLEDDPSKDGWESEVQSQNASKQFKKLASFMFKADDSTPPAERLSPSRQLLADSFRGHGLRPANLNQSYDSDGLSVHRWAADDSSEQRELNRQEWIDAFGKFSEPFRGAELPRYEVKVLGARLKANKEFSSRLRLQASGVANGEHLQVQLDVECHWSADAKKMLAAKLLTYEEVRNRDAALSFYTECTGSVFSGGSEYIDQLSPGYDEWYARTPKVFGRTFWADNGISLGDVNGDFLDDIYVCEPGGLPNRLFIRQPDGGLKDVSRDAGVDWLDNTRSALIVDLDNDGDQDLVVAVNGAVLLMSNDGAAKFTLRAKSLSADSPHAMSAADFDGDGLLDIYVCSYAKEAYGAEEFPIPIPYFDATNGGSNRLLKNLGDWKFEDVTEASGMNANNNRWSLAATWEDYDNDGDPDLYVANDFGRNCLYQNTDGKFRNVAAEAGVEDVGSGMSAAWGDFNRDGLMDLYVSNMFSTAGSRITEQDQFKSETAPALRALYRRMSKGNTLYQNQGNGKFRDVSLQASVARGRWAWGAPFVDINNDGWEDLIVANGFVTHKDTHDL